MIFTTQGAGGSTYMASWISELHTIVALDAAIRDILVGRS